MTNDNTMDFWNDDRSYNDFNLVHSLEFKSDKDSVKRQSAKGETMITLAEVIIWILITLLIGIEIGYELGKQKGIRFMENINKEFDKLRESISQDDKRGK